MANVGRISVQGIDEEVWAEFKERVIVRFGKLHTVLGLEVEKAIKEYMAEHPENPNTHTHEKKEEKVEEIAQNHKPKIPGGIMSGASRGERINNIGELLMNGTEEITDAGLRRFVVMQGVSDERVVEGYIKTMKLKGWLAPRGKKETGVVVFRSTISAALHINLPRETVEKMMESYQLPGQPEGNGGSLVK